MQAEAVGAGRGLDVTTVTGIFTHDLEGFADRQGHAVVVPGEGLVNVGEGGRRHGEHDTAPASTEVTSSTKHGPPASSRYGKTARDLGQHHSSAFFSQFSLQIVKQPEYAGQ